MVWKKVADPSVSFKTGKGGDRGSISAPAGSSSFYAYIVDADYQRKEWIIWFQTFVDTEGKWQEGTIRLPWLTADPWAFDAWNHEGTLKIVFKHYAPDTDNHRRFGVYNTGWRDV
jgi:hypothetical protein